MECRSATYLTTLISKFFLRLCWVFVFFLGGCGMLNVFVAFIFILWFVYFNKWPYIKKS